MQHPNATWNEFSTHLINKDVTYEVFTNLLNDEEQNKGQIASLGQEFRNLRTELREQRVNTVEGNQKTIDPNQEGRRGATRFSGYYRTNGPTPRFCRKKMRDEELEKLQNKATAEKMVIFTHDYNKRRGPSHGYGNWISRNDDKGAMLSTPQRYTSRNFRRSIRLPTTLDNIDFFLEGTTRITTILDTMITQQGHQTSRTKMNLGIGEVIITIHDRLQRHDQTHSSRISAENSDQIHLIFRC